MTTALYHVMVTRRKLKKRASGVSVFKLIPREVRFRYPISKIKCLTI